jgi:hypothetical protein
VLHPAPGAARACRSPHSLRSLGAGVLNELEHQVAHGDDYSKKYAAHTLDFATQ